ncbi:hypothetical protein JNK13_06835 [bacterium]|nr:hypothetical protein [bacterium]
MKIKFADDVKQAFPRQYSAVFGPVTVPQDLMLVKDLSASLAKACEAKFPKDSIALPEQVKHWRALYAQMQAPGGTEASVAALFKRYKMKHMLWEINPIVDFYNWTSLLNLTPMAAYDLSGINGDLVVRFGREADRFTPLGKPESVEVPLTTEVVYVDSEKVICRFWNNKDSHLSRIQDSTRELIFVADITADSFEQAQAEMSKFSSYLKPIFGDFYSSLS